MLYERSKSSRRLPACLFLLFFHVNRTEPIDHNEDDQHHDRKIQRAQLPSRLASAPSAAPMT